MARRASSRDTHADIHLNTHTLDGEGAGEKTQPGPEPGRAWRAIPSRCLAEGKRILLDLG